MVTRNDFAATVGCASTRNAASRRSSAPVSSAGHRGGAGCAVSRCIFGGLPKRTSIGRSLGWSGDFASNSPFTVPFFPVPAFHRFVYSDQELYRPPPPHTP